VELGYIEDPGEDKTDAMMKAGIEAKYNLSRVYQSKKDYVRSIGILRELMELKKDDIRIGLDLTKCLINTSDYAGARLSLDICRKTEYGQLPVLDFLEGVINFSEGHNREALDFLRTAERSDPRMPELHLQLGKLYLQVHEYDDAESAFTKALDIDENSAAAYLGLGISVLRQGRYEEAVDFLLSSLGLIYHFPIAHYHLGEALYHLEKFKEASEAFEVCLRMAPKLLKARRFLVKIYEGPYPDPSRLNVHRDILKQRMKGTVVVVSGLPRSGTSLMMQMLQAGGMPLLTDGVRQPDENNPKGYYELDAVKRSTSDISWVVQAEDKAVKVIAQLLYNLPNNYEFKVIFMQRDIKEVMLSQQKMLGKSPAYNMSLAAVFEKEIEKVKAWEKQQPNVDILYVPYAEIVDSPVRHVYRIADFVGYPLDTEAMKEAVDRSLYRNRSISGQQES
ncbi:MAG: tetratricopeptide repeat protein, partial [Bacteroidales bacterium]|nr:tetratricopeptide repeat protein [Bacteroidales bacterium]